jgi:GH15 family glucan-1,4-alpha-glucosidase
VNREHNLSMAFVQYYGTTDVDSALLMNEVGLPADDPRLIGTIAAIEQDLLRGGFVDRYRTESGVEELPAREGAFLLCTFWLADNYALMGRRADARRIFQGLLCWPFRMTSVCWLRNTTLSRNAIAVTSRGRTRISA